MQSQRHGRSVALALLACLLGASAARPQNPPAPALVIRDVTVVSPERAAPRDAPEVVGVDRLLQLADLGQ